jgi:hypothetical protein
VEVRVSACPEKVDTGFSKKDMREQETPEHILIPSNQDALWQIERA